MTLANFQTPEGFLTIAPFDHRGSLAKSLALELSKPEDQATFLMLKRLFIQIFSPHVSAVLTDPEYGIQTLDAKDPKCGLFLSLEESSYGASGEDMTILRDNWGVDGVRAHQAGAKLLVYYNPQSSTAQAKLALVEQLAAECRAKQVVFLVEPVLYALPEKQWDEDGDVQWIALHLEVCRQFAPHCDILKIQYPGSAQACATVSSLHPNWILLSRGAKFDAFTEYMKTAARNGAKGYAAGRAVWQEITELPTERWEEFLKTTAVDRLKQLTHILQTSTLIA